ncbi:MAG: hypothetical protein U0797_12590 [Gemmataceae bacterium]
MAEQHTINAKWISSIVVLALLAVTGVASAIIWGTGDWEQHAWGLALTLRILWGVWMVIALVTVLTRVTIFGWSFRRYARWAEDNMPAWTKFRPTKAPWSKSAAVSFSFTVLLTWLTGACLIATAVMWILSEQTGWWVFVLVFKIIWASWWVLMVALVVARNAVFGVQRRKALEEATNKPEPSLAGSDKAESNS